MSVVSTSVDLSYGVRSLVSPGKSYAIQYNVRKLVSNSSYSLVYSVRMIMPQGKVLNLKYGARQIVSKSTVVVYNVMVVLSIPKTIGLIYSVRMTVSYNPSVLYDTSIVGTTTVSKTLGIVYHTLIKPSGIRGGAFSSAFSSAYDSGVGTTKPSVDLVIAIPSQSTNVFAASSKLPTNLISTTSVEADSATQQIVTTSF